MKESKRGIGLSFAINGLKESFLHERNFRIHLVIACFVIICSFIFRLNAIEWAMVLIAICFVLMMELVNSAIERIINYVKPAIHPEAKVIKDIAAGAVLVSVCLSVLLGCIIFIPKLIALF